MRKNTIPRINTLPTPSLNSRATAPILARSPPPRRLSSLLAGLFFCLASAVAAAFPAELFGYRQLPQEQIADFPQWLRVLERHLQDDVKAGPGASDCQARVFNRCHLAEWRRFLDIDNYGIEDYWAIPREFLGSGGDCEDYVITKLFSLLWLGYPADDLRLVVVQDTNLRVPHAVLAVARAGETLILDNQVQAVLPDREVVHYVPVFSINESRWWIHLPPT